MQEENQAIDNSEVLVDQPIEENLNEAVEELDDTNEELAEDSQEEREQTADEGVDGDEEDDTPFPKKATRALERRNKKINKLRAENDELQRKLAEYSRQPQEQKQFSHNQELEGLKEPQEDDYADYAEYLEARGEYKAKKAQAAERAQMLQEQDFQSHQLWVKERAEYVDKRAAEAVKTIPELNGLYIENQDIIEGYSDTTKMAFLEADAPELAFYAFAKEGKLETLDSMSPTRLAREIALAEIRGAQISKARPVTKAPAPIKPARGSGTSRKMLDDMTPNELLEYMNKRKK